MTGGIGGYEPPFLVTSEELTPEGEPKGSASPLPPKGSRKSEKPPFSANGSLPAKIREITNSYKQQK